MQMTSVPGRSQSCHKCCCSVGQARLVNLALGVSEAVPAWDACDDSELAFVALMWYV